MSQGGLSTSNAAEKILENEPAKLKEELKARQKELGLDAMVPTKKQGILQQLDDIKEEKNNILDQMQKAKEERLKRDAERKKANQKTPEQRLKMIFAHEERKARDAYDRRRIRFLDGGMDELVGTIRMLPFRVLLKEIRTVAVDGIELPVSHAERMPKYAVVAVGDGSDGIEEGMVVMVEAYAGIEIVSKDEIYRVVTCDDILCAVEE